jgi:hypothetical protein
VCVCVCVYIYICGDENDFLNGREFIIESLFHVWKK